MTASDLGTADDQSPPTEPQRTPLREPSPAQLRTIVRHLATSYLEVERGLRPPDHLHPYLTPEAYDRLRQRPRKALARGGPVGPRDMGPISLTTYPRTGRTYASLTARGQDDRWGGLLIQLHQAGAGRLIVDELQRVPMRPLARHVEPPVEFNLLGQVEWIERELDLVEAACLAEGATGISPSSHAGRLSELRREIADLRSQIDHGQQVEATKHTLEVPPLHVTKLLGKPPAYNTWQRLQWDSARDAILAYRQRYDIDDTSALGPVPATQQQREVRHATIRIVRIAQRSLAHNSPDASVDRLLDRAPSLER